jgi:hypothetical protein
MERYAAAHPRTPLFVRPYYDDTTWVPTTIDFGVLRDGGLWWERFRNGA